METFGYSRLFAPEELEYAFFRDVTPEVSLGFDTFHDLRAHYPRRILEIQCGSGLLAKGYAERGGEVVAIDSAPGMISYARSRREKTNITWQVEHPLDLSVKDIDLAVMCLDSYAYLLTDEDERRFWRKIKDALNDDGLFLLEVNHPKSCGYIDYSTVYTEDRPLDDIEVRVEWGVNNPIPDLITGICETEIRCTTTRGGRVETRIINSRERYHWPRDLKLMLESCGFKVARWFGGYERQILEWDSPVVILLIEPVKGG